jgi:hypothetical protein
MKPKKKKKPKNKLSTNLKFQEIQEKQVTSPNSQQTGAHLDQYNFLKSVEFELQVKKKERKTKKKKKKKKNLKYQGV